MYAEIVSKDHWIPECSHKYIEDFTATDTGNSIPVTSPLGPVTVTLGDNTRTGAVAHSHTIRVAVASAHHREPYVFETS